MSVCASVCHHSFVWLGLFLCTLIRYTGFYGYSFLCLVGCFSMIIWTPTVLSVLYACVLHFCICTCSAQLSMFHMERSSRNMLILLLLLLLIIIIIIMCNTWGVHTCSMSCAIWYKGTAPLFKFDRVDTFNLLTKMIN